MNPNRSGASEIRATRDTSFPGFYSAGGRTECAKADEGRDDQSAALGGGPIWMRSPMYDPMSVKSTPTQPMMSSPTRKPKRRTSNSRLDPQLETPEARHLLLMTGFLYISRWIPDSHGCAPRSSRGTRAHTSGGFAVDDSIAAGERLHSRCRISPAGAACKGHAGH